MTVAVVDCSQEASVCSENKVILICSVMKYAIACLSHLWVKYDIRDETSFQLIKGHMAY